MANGPADGTKGTFDGRQTPIALRKLHLYGFEARVFMVGVPVTDAIAAHENRLLDWLDRSPSIAPQLMSLGLHLLFSSSFKTEAFDRLFRGLALHGALEELVLDRCGHVGLGAVSRAAIERVASAVRQPRRKWRRRTRAPAIMSSSMRRSATVYSRV